MALNGHVDVVPAGANADWTYPPYSAEIRDGEIWGRDSLDMKAGVGAMLFAALMLKHVGIMLKGDVVRESVIDDETGGPGTRSSIERGYRPDFALVVVPTTDLAIMPVEGRNGCVSLSPGFPVIPPGGTRASMLVGKARR